MAGDASDYGMRACLGRWSYVVRRANQNEFKTHTESQSTLKTNTESQSKLKTHTESYNKLKTHPERGIDSQSSVPHPMEAKNSENHES